MNLILLFYLMSARSYIKPENKNEVTVLTKEIKDKDFLSALSIIRGELKARLINLPEGFKLETAEIRLRIGKPVVLFGTYSTAFLSRNEGVTKNPEDAFICYSEDMNDIFSRLCSFSVHSHLQSIVNGFITIQGGHRVGICGTAVTDNRGNITSVRDVSSLNIRIAREKPGCSRVIYNTLFHSSLQSIIIAGAPMSGKTTVLRDLVRSISDSYDSKKICVIDERQEIAAMNAGFCQRDVGVNTDVFDLYPKDKAVLNAVKTMSPHLIAMDELCTDGEIEAISLAANSGVKFIVTVHASDYTEILTRPQIKSLLRAYSFEKLVLLKKDIPGEIEGIYDTKELLDEIIGRDIGLNRCGAFGDDDFLSA